MSLTIGDRLGPYEILAPIGAGGMGEVYKATDTRLHREVAVKVLPQSFATEAARERFQREARAASALNHPHICAVHDVGESSGHPYLVMELLSGTTLRQHIGGKPLDIPAALALSIQVADALGCGPLQRNRSSRYQAGQHLRNRARSRQGSRLRFSSATQFGRHSSTDRNDAHRTGFGHGHHRLHVAGTSAR